MPQVVDPELHLEAIDGLLSGMAITPALLMSRSMCECAPRIRSAAAALSLAMATALDCGRVPGRPPLAVTWVPLGKRRKRGANHMNCGRD